MMMIEKTIHIEDWYPWANILIIEGKKYIISDEVNDTIWGMYENHLFSKRIKPIDLLRGPFVIEIRRLFIKGSYHEQITKLKYTGPGKIRITKGYAIRRLIVKDRAKAKEWVEHVKEQRKITKEKEETVGEIKVNKAILKVIKVLKSLQQG